MRDVQFGSLWSTVVVSVFYSFSYLDTIFFCCQMLPLSPIDNPYDHKITLYLQKQNLSVYVYIIFVEFVV